MKEVIRKIKRVQPLIKAKKAELDAAATVLARLRKNKTDAVAELRMTQQKYMDGVNSINNERTNGLFHQAAAMEGAIESVKNRWHATLRQISELENMERQQIEHVLTLQTKLKSFETIEEQYKIEKLQLEAKLEQKELDDMVTMRRK